ncbi:MAG: class I SAM-dependent methyltransferase [Anaerolineae bacterium]
MAKPNYGNWIRKHILARFLIVALGLCLASFIPLPGAVRLGLIVFACGFFLMFLYLAYIYYQFSEQGGGFQRKMHQALLNHLSWDGQGNGLDIGTGNGALAIRLAQKFPRALVLGIDLWGENWEYSKAVCEENARIEAQDQRVHFQQGTAAALPSTDGAFNAVVSHFVFHEVTGVAKTDVLKEAFRVLRKGGSFSFQDMFLDSALYGDIPALLNTLHEWGIEEVRFVPSSELVKIPYLLRHKRVLGRAGLLFGRK